jgi:glycolate oxidase FAD binding subunit
MIIECGAGTAIDDVQSAAGEVGQYVNFPQLPGGSGTVGGALALGHSDVRRLGRGAVRDALLRARLVGHDGAVITAGGSTVKNVSGFDLCRLLVGSKGTLGFLGEVLLRTQPLPLCSQWYSAPVIDHEQIQALRRNLYRPSAALWNGTVVMMCLEGHHSDIAASVQLVRLQTGIHLQETDAPDLRNFPHRSSLAAAQVPDVVREFRGRCWAEVGVGTVHFIDAQPTHQPSLEVRAITRRLLDAFDPTGRMNPNQMADQGAASIH